MRHRDRKEPVDEACRAASRDHGNAWNRATSRLAKRPERANEYAALLKKHKGNTNRARGELARSHRAEFRQLLFDELAKLGRRRCECGAEILPGSTCWACPPESAIPGGLVPEVHWRQGRKVGRTLYIHRSGSESGQLVGMVDTPELAAEICEAMNARGSTERSGESRAADERP
ncbi:hypothetical protein [Actinomadura meridiana]|uniref:hypothetical protein n=1 Tax=Actinomadura meridiana TaxID=559626 RepID=UPI0031EDAAA4